MKQKYTESDLCEYLKLDEHDAELVHILQRTINTKDALQLVKVTRGTYTRQDITYYTFTNIEVSNVTVHAHRLLDWWTKFHVNKPRTLDNLPLRSK